MVRISDFDILQILIHNSRTPYVKIAEKLNVSEAAIRKRIRKMEEQGIIERYTIDINPQKLGFNKVLIGIDTKPEFLFKTMKKLKEMKEAINVVSSSGDHMMLVEAWFENTTRLEGFISKLEGIEGVTRVCPAVIIETVKSGAALTSLTKSE
ncbi:MAG: Lrp/AsnC family transcriptional regulator [Candidatus Hodarchaeales archaeon]